MTDKDGGEFFDVYVWERNDNSNELVSGEALRQAIDDGIWRMVTTGLRDALQAMEGVDWQRKFDALIAAVFELEDDQRDAILARARELESADPVDEDDE